MPGHEGVTTLPQIACLQKVSTSFNNAQRIQNTIIKQNVYTVLTYND